MIIIRVLLCVHVIYSLCHKQCFPCVRCKLNFFNVFRCNIKFIFIKTITNPEHLFICRKISQVVDVYTFIIVVECFGLIFQTNRSRPIFLITY